MAEVEKFTDDGVTMLLKHSDRLLTNDANKEIIEKRSDLNYSIPIDTGRLKPKEYYRKMVNESYLYGRGSKREAEAVTCCGWVVTLPRSVSDYSFIKKDNLTQINPNEEKQFFNGVTDFVLDRYGTVFYNRVHYDEGGQPHIHIYFVPRTNLDHDKIHFKTMKTHQPVRTESGRYEFATKYRLDANGERIPVHNYAKLSDYYNTKISGADVLNKAELQHFHSDLADYLKKNNLPGSSAVYTGKTKDRNISVSSMKEFTRATGKTIEELREHPVSCEHLKDMLSLTNLRPAECRTIEVINMEATITHLQGTIATQAATIHHYDQALERIQNEYNRALDRIKELEHTKEHDLDAGWGSTGWNQTNSTKDITYDKEV